MEEIYFDNYKKELCNGCGICTLVCPQKCIHMEVEQDTYEYPVIDEEKCINCGKCKRICSNKTPKITEESKSYMGINLNKTDLAVSSSGGMYIILAQHIIGLKGVVIGVRKTDNLMAKHDYTETIEGCYDFCGSKYVRSNTDGIYEKTKEFLVSGRYVLFTGTPCQISALKNFLNKEYEKLYTCEILCHGNPSPKILNMYIRNIEKIYKKKIVDIDFRSKKTGWKNQKTLITFEDGNSIQNDGFYNAFARDMISRDSCLHCKFATLKRNADITIGDFWGVNRIFKEIEDDDSGISLFNVNTQKGNMLFNAIKQNLKYYEVENEKIQMLNRYHNYPIHKKREEFIQKLRTNQINENNVVRYFKKNCVDSISFRICRKIKRLIKKKQI